MASLPSCSRRSAAGTPESSASTGILIESIKRGRVAIVHAYLAKGASANARDDKGGTALHWAAARGEDNVVELLLANGAVTDVLDFSGKTPLAVAESRGKSSVASLLRGRGAR